MKPKVERGKGHRVRKDGDAHSPLDGLIEIRTDHIRLGDVHPVRDERPERAT